MVEEHLLIPNSEPKLVVVGQAVEVHFITASPIQVQALAPVSLVRGIAEVLLFNTNPQVLVVVRVRPGRAVFSPITVETVVVVHLARYQVLSSMPVVVEEGEKNGG